MRASILGLFNSGSSVMSEIVERLGASIGRPLWGHHFESRSLRAQLVDWWSFPDLKEEVTQGDRVPFLRWWAEHHEKGARVVCAKNPLLCLCASDLDLAWGPEHKVIRASRPLDVSVAKLRARKWYRYPEKIQHRLHAACEDYFDQKEHLSVEYEKLLANPVWETRRIAEYLELDCSQENLAMACAVVRPKISQ